MLEDANISQIMSWSDNGDAVMIWSEENLGRILPRYGFKTNNFSAIQRQLNFYGFRKATQGKNPTVYKHDYFYRGSPYLHEIKKRTAVRSSPKAVEPVRSQRVTRSATKSASWPSSPSLGASVTQSSIAFTEADITQEILEVLEPSTFSQESSNFSTLMLPPVTPVPVAHVVPQEKFETKRLSEENRMLREEMMRLRAQQEATQMMMREILAQLQQNKEETDSLKNLVNNLIQSQQNPSNEIFAAPREEEQISMENVNLSDLPQFDMLQQEWKLEDIQFDQLSLLAIQM